MLLLRHASRVILTFEVHVRQDIIGSRDILELFLLSLRWCAVYRIRMVLFCELIKLLFDISLGGITFDPQHPIVVDISVKLAQGREVSELGLVNEGALKQ